jgi:hypothetical protein
MKELVDALVHQLNIDKSQATSGAAILFKAARDRLGPQQFETLLKGVPGVDELLRNAPESGSVGKLFGGFASALGGSNAATLAGIVAGFSRIGLSTDHAKRFAPVILDFLNSKVGQDRASAIEKSIRALF